MLPLSLGGSVQPACLKCALSHAPRAVSAHICIHSVAAAVAFPIRSSSSGSSKSISIRSPACVPSGLAQHNVADASASSGIPASLRPHAAAPQHRRGQRLDIPQQQQRSKLGSDAASSQSNDGSRQYYKSATSSLSDDGLLSQSSNTESQSGSSAGINISSGLGKAKRHGKGRKGSAKGSTAAELTAGATAARINGTSQPRDHPRSRMSPCGIPKNAAADSSSNSSSSKSSSTSRSSGASDQQPFRDIRLKTFHQLQTLLAEHGASARISDITAMMSRLKNVECRSPADKVLLLDQLWQLLLPQLPWAAARHCAEVMLTASKLGSCPPGLFPACLQQFIKQVDKAEARLVSNTIYAIATAPSDSIRTDSQQQLQQVLLPAFLQRLPAANSQSVANVAYALAVLGFSNARQQLQQLLLEVQPQLWKDSNPQEVSNTLWAAGVLGLQLPKLHQEAMLRLILAAAGKARPQEITNCVYGLTLMQQHLSQQHHQQLAKALLQTQPDAQAISGFLWCSGKMGLPLQQRQVDAFVQQLLLCRQQLVPQGIALALWGIATLQLRVNFGLLLQLLQQLATAAPEPQALSVSLWAAAKLGVGLPFSLLDKLYSQLAKVIQQAEPQAVSNALWAAAVMSPQPYLPTAILGDQHMALTRQQQQQDKQGQQARMLLKPQDQQQQRQQKVLAAVVSKVPGMKPLELSNVAWALAVLGIRDMAVLGPVFDIAMDHLGGQLNTPHSNSLGSNTDSSSDSSSSSSSSGSSQGVGSSTWPGVIDAGRGGPTLGSSSSSTDVHVMGRQALMNLCWAGAILDLQERRQQVEQLAQAAAALCPPDFSELTPEDATQLYQVHLWLLELVGTQGLQGCLSQQQLKRCREGMRVVVATTTTASQLQQQVFEVALRVPGLKEVQLEAATDDGLLSVDVAAVLDPRSAGVSASPSVGRANPQAAAAAAASTGQDVRGVTGKLPGTASTGEVQEEELSAAASAIRIAIEVDGPYHFRQPDQEPTGPTLFRNRLLEQRGYHVVSVPYWRWQRLDCTKDRALYLQDELYRAGRH